jgi:hypothetical protein
MRALTVLREIPSKDAVREMFQPVCSSAAARCRRMASSSEPRALRGDGDAAGAASGSCSMSAVTTGASASSATRSITLKSSRMLPGHAYASRCASALGDKTRRGRP